MQNLEEVFDYIKLLPFLIDYAEVNPNSGIRTRKTGKGTNKNDKNKSFTEADKQALKKGWLKFKTDVDKIMNTIPEEDGN